MKKPSTDGVKQPAVTTTAPTAHQRAIGGLTPPDHLSDEALSEWVRVVTILFARNALDSLDAVALADYAECYGRLRQCEREVAERGVLVEGRDGAMVRNPAIMAAKGYRDSMVKWSRLFGISIGARKQVSLPSGAQEKPNRFRQFDEERIRRVK